MVVFGRIINNLLIRNAQREDVAQDKRLFFNFSPSKIPWIQPAQKRERERIWDILNCICLCIYIYVYMYIYICVCVCVCVCVCMCVYILCMDDGRLNISRF